MKHQRIANVREGYSTCEECSLASVRQSLGQEISFGSGNVNARGMLITPLPVVSNKDTMVQYDADTREGEILRAIFEKARLDISDWYFTSTVACGGLRMAEEKLLPECVRACNSRLKKQVYIVQPEVVVVSGPASVFAYFGEVPPDKDEEGWYIMESAHRSVVFADDLTEYNKKVLELGREHSTTSMMASGIMRSWMSVSRHLMDTSSR